MNSHDPVDFCRLFLAKLKKVLTLIDVSLSMTQKKTNLIAIALVTLLIGGTHSWLTSVHGQRPNSEIASFPESPRTDIGIGSNQNRTINLLNASTFDWETVNYARIGQSNDDLDITVETDSPDKIYNRAYLQTQLNFTQSQPLVLLLDYVAEIFQGNATFVIEVKDQENNNILLSRPLNVDEMSRAYLISPDIINKPIEFVFYVITDEPASSTLALNDASISTLSALTSALANIQDSGGKSTVRSAADESPQNGLSPFPWIFRQQNFFQAK